MTDEKQNLAEIARKKRYLHLIEKMHGGKPLSNQEIKELEDFEAESLGEAVVKTMEEVARIMDVSYRTVQRWKKDGMPVTKDGYYDLDQIKAWHDGTGISDDEEELQGKAYWDEKIRKFKATLLELETRKATGELIPREDVEKGQIARVMAIKRAFLALPSQVAPKLAMKEPREIEVIIYEAISAIVDEFAGVKNNEEEVVDVSDAQRGPADLEQRGTTSVAPASEDNSQSVG